MSATGGVMVLFLAVAGIWAADPPTGEQAVPAQQATAPGPEAGPEATGAEKEDEGQEPSARKKGQPTNGADKTRQRLEAERIARMLTAQQDAWNRGDLDAFMTAYWKSDALRFASGGTETLGWKPTLKRYKKYYDSREKMGTLTFSDIDISMLGKDAALAFGRWKLERPRDAPTGLFTLLLRKMKGKWVIVHDHTSSE